MKIVELMFDHDMENPSEFDGAWKIYSFSRRHNSYADPETFFHRVDGEIVPNRVGLRRKLATGTAFVLSYYEHGNCEWSLANEGPQCRWDSTPFAGLLVWERSPKDMGAKTYADRAKDARMFLESYTAYCNGDGYGYSVTEELGLECGHKERKIVDSCFGFYGNDLTYMASEIRAAIAGDEFRVEGEAEGVSEYLNLKGKQKGIECAK